MIKHLTLTVGIPAYNEEANICQLIDDVLAQNYGDLSLEKIIVSSDASTDKTNELVEAYSDPRVALLSNDVRGGISTRLNQLFETATTSFLVVLNADTRIKDPLFMQKITAPLLEKTDMTSARIEEIPGSSLIENAVIFGMQIKRQTVESINNGQNVYTCCGLARAFSKKLYTKMRFETSVGEDAFSFFYTRAHSYKYSYVRNTSIIYKISSEYIQHRRQTLRFFESQRIMKERFGREFVSQMYHVPMKNMIAGLVWGLMTHPFQTCMYVGTVVFARMSVLVGKGSVHQTWQVATSSKKIEI